LGQNPAGAIKPFVCRRSRCRRRRGLIKLSIIFDGKTGKKTK